MKNRFKAFTKDELDLLGWALLTHRLSICKDSCQYESEDSTLMLNKKLDAERKTALPEVSDD